MPLRVIGLLSGPGGHTIRLGDLLSGDVEAEYRRAISLLEAFRASREIAPVMNGNLFTFLGTKVQLLALMSQPRTDRAEMIRLYRELNRTFANLLSSIRLFRDHTLRRLSHTYGRSSSQRFVFESAWSNAVKSDFAFGFIWEFRNYVQHFGMPFDIASVSIATPPTDPSKRIVELGIATATLLRYEKWGDLRSEIGRLGDVIPVQDYVQSAVTTLNAIDSTLVAEEIPVLATAGKAVVRILRPGFSDGAYPGTMEVENENLPTGLRSFRLAPIEMLDFLGLAKAEQTSEGPRTKLNDAA